MSDQSSIELRLTGQGISPGAIRSKDIAQLIEAVEDMIASQVVADNPDIKKDQVVVGLSDIEKGSAGLLFASSLEELTSTATKEIATSIQTGDFYMLTSDSVNSLKVISAFTKSRECNAELYELNGTRNLLATITPETKIIEYEPIKGETTIYGTVTRVGGVNEQKPTIQFRTIEGYLVYCSSNKSNAKRAAQSLYQQVGLSGIASWDSKTFRVISFDIKEVSEYTSRPLSNSFNSISEEYGETFDAIKDVEAFAYDLRNGG